jgi:arylsulfatase A-like enzyme
MSAANSLGYVAAMQEHGVPVTYAYISDAHDAHPSGPAYGPGQAGYVAALKSYDEAFGTFFSRLAADGINSSNTIFTFTADEGDHFVGIQQTGCDGVTTPCVYGPNQIGEVNTNMAGLLATEQGITTPFTVHSDDAPTVYITGNPAHDAAVTRTFERATGALTAVNPYTGVTQNLTRALADPAEMQLLHMVTADPARTPTFTWFANPDYFLFAGARNCSSPCVTINSAFAWNHGDIGQDINVTWLGVVGPGVRNLGVKDDLWTDHSDIRPTLLALAGLDDDYMHSGRPITEIMTGTRQDLDRLAAVYKQINAPVGQLGLDSAAFATRAILSSSAGDQQYLDADSTLASWTAQRDALASQMIALLDFTAPGATTHHNDRDVNDLIVQGQQLLDTVHSAASAG